MAAHKPELAQLLVAAALAKHGANVRDKPATSQLNLPKVKLAPAAAAHKPEALPALTEHGQPVLGRVLAPARLKPSRQPELASG